MKTLNEQLCDFGGWDNDSFKPLYEKWQKALKDLEDDVARDIIRKTEYRKNRIGFESQEDEKLTEIENFLKSQIESSLEKCFKKIDSLQGSAKCFGLVGSFIRSNDIEQSLRLLEIAKEEIEKRRKDGAFRRKFS